MAQRSASSFGPAGGATARWQGDESKIGRNNFEGTFAGNGKMRVLFCADKNTAAQFLRECARVRVRARMRKYTDFQKAGLLNNLYYTPVLFY